MAGSSVGSIIKWGAIGLGAYWLYTNYFAAAVPVVAAAPGVTPPTVVPPVVTQPAPVLDGIYARMVALAAADGVTTAGPDAWDVYAVRAGGPNPMPAPEAAGLKRPSGVSVPPPPVPAPGDLAAAAAYPGLVQAWVLAQGTANDAGKYTASQYWAAMAPVLRSQLGLSGLGHFAGLGRLYGYGVAN